MKFYSLALAVVFFFSGLANGAQKPNVVIFLADDSGWGDYSTNGNSNIRTPNIDSLARTGATLDRFYVCPVCSPTRAEFLTGRYYLRCGVRGVSTGMERLNLDEKTIADSFKSAGYATGAFGKWHNGSQWPYHPNARGFDQYYGFTSGHWGEYFDPPLEENGKPVRGKGFVADDFTSHALSFIDKNKDRPFFCYVPFNTPHSPWAVPQDYWSRFKNDPVRLRAKPGDPEELDQTRCALAMVENLDWNVGRVLAKLDELNLAENTIVLYFSDNGPNSWRWNGGMKGRKGSVDEGGVRSACFIRWPGRIPAGRVVKEISGALDCLPTLTSLAGIPRVGTKPLDGVNLAPLLTGKVGQLDKERVIFSSWGGNISVRSREYRCNSNGELFDMTADPGQTRNISKDKIEIANGYALTMSSWMKDVMGKDFPPLGQGKAKGSNLFQDNRPIPVGAGGLAFPLTSLPARDGVAHGEIKRSASAPNSSYFVNWKTKEGNMTWNIAVDTPGEYEVTILYTATEEGARIELSFNGSQLAGRVQPAWNPPLYTNQDTISRPPAESKMKEFRPLKLGRINLEKVRGLLTLRALEIPGQGVMDVRQINLLLLKPSGMDK